MRIISLLILAFFTPKGANAQIEITAFEQIAIDYFAEEIIPSYHQLSYFIFDGNLEKDASLSNSFCLVLQNVADFKETENEKIKVPYPLIKKLGFLKKILISRKKTADVYVFKHYPKDGDIVVVICVSNRNIDDFYSILIEKRTKKVKEHCRKRFYQ
jgi:hypothetical protein